MNTDRLHARIRALLAKTTDNGCTVEEAAAAAAMAQRLMTEHSIEAAVLEESPDEPEEEIVDFGDREGGHLDGGGRIPKWKLSLTRVVTDNNGCTYYYYPGRSIEVVGRPSDVDAVRYLYQYLSREIERLCKRDSAGMGRTFANSFRLGAVQTVGRRLHEAREEAFQQAKADAFASGGESALVPLQNALVRVDSRGQEASNFLNSKHKLKAAKRTRTRTSFAGLSAGRRAGESISLGSSGPSLTAGNKAIGSGR